MGEIEGEHYNNPYLEEGKDWQIKSNESTLLARALEKCRGNFGEPYAYATANILETWNRKEEAPLDDYPDFNNNKTFENRLIKQYNQIKIIDHQTKEVLHTLKNIPGLFIQGCSFKNLHPDSQLSDEEKELLKMYGGTVE